MCKFKFLIVLPTLILFISCNIKINSNCIQEDNDQQIDYVVNPHLSSAIYSDAEGNPIPEVGVVSTPEVAFQMAEIVLKHIYGNEKIESEKPFSINLENDIWMIEGNPSQEMFGGVAYIEIQKSNGKILKVIHTL